MPRERSAASQEIEEDALEERLLDLHERIRTRVSEAQRRGSLAAGGDPTDREAAVAGQGAGDVSFGLDVAAESEIEAFAEDLARKQPIVVVSEGFGVKRFGAAGVDPVWRLVIDPIDGTRNLMFDLRSGWVLTAIAPERGTATRLSDVRVAVQSELPVRDKTSAVILSAVRGRGRGARQRTRDLSSGAIVDDRALVASADARLEPGFFVFFKFNYAERRTIADIEQRFLESLVKEHGVDGRLLFDDQYISSAGQLHLLITRRYRFLADLRGVVGDRLGIENQTSKPYDVCCALIAEEAGVPLSGFDGRPFDVPLDLESRVSLVGYANPTVRAKLEPLLRRALHEVLGI